MSHERTIRRTIENLRSTIAHHEHQYRDLLEPEISDAEYDALHSRLVELEGLYPEHAQPSEIGSDLTAQRPTIQHDRPMLSLNSTTSAETLHAYFDRYFGVPLHDYTLGVSHKLDGMALRLRYLEGKLTAAVTRGDGVRGEDVLINAMAIPTIPLAIALTERTGGPMPPEFEVTGEVVVLRANFEDYNDQARREGTKVYSNPRAMAAAAMRVLDPLKTSAMKPQFIAYGAEGLPIGAQQIVMDFLSEVGFLTVPTILVDSPTRLDEALEAVEHGRRQFPYDIDGAVVALESYELRRRLGEVTTHPNWAMAFKYPAQEAFSPIVGVSFQTGRTGGVTPVLKVKAVALSGIAVQSVTLHNAHHLERAQIRIGDVAVIRKAGDVIPQFVKSLPRGTGELIKMTKYCESCGTELVDYGSSGARCPNTLGCPAQAIAALMHFTGSRALDIDGLGANRIATLYRAGQLKAPADIFRLTVPQLEVSLGISKHHAEKLTLSVAASKLTTLPRLLTGLGIEGIGSTTALALSRAFHFDMAEILHAKMDDFLRVPGMDKCRAKAAERYCAVNYEAIMDLISCGLSWPVTTPMPLETTRPLEGKVIVVTGRVVGDRGEGIPRSVVAAYYRNLGAEVTENVTRRVDMVLTGERPSDNKLVAANALRIQVRRVEAYNAEKQLPPIQ